MAIDHTASLVNLETISFVAPAGVGTGVRLDAPGKANSVYLQAPDDLLVTLTDQDGVAVSPGFTLAADVRHLVWLSGIIPGETRDHPAGTPTLTVASSVAGTTTVVAEYRS